MEVDNESFWDSNYDWNPIRKPSASNVAGKIVFDKVLLVDDGNETKVGAPYVAGAKVSAELVEEGLLCVVVGGHGVNSGPAGMLPLSRE